jgi:hypothetical protein
VDLTECEKGKLPSQQKKNVITAKIYIESKPTSKGPRIGALAVRSEVVEIDWQRFLTGVIPIVN